MNWIEYQKQSIRTLASFKNTYAVNLLEGTNVSSDVRGSIELLAYNADLAHCALGIHSEFEELNRAIKVKDSVNIAEEIADTFWYVSGIIYILGINDIDLRHSKRVDLTLNSYFEPSMNSLTCYTSQFQDSVKQILAYKKRIKPKLLDDQLLSIIQELRIIANHYKIDIEKALQNNIDKLKKRFPDKFSESQAINRDLDKEREELEK